MLEMTEQMIEGEAQHRGVAGEPERLANQVDLVLLNQQRLAHQRGLLDLLRSFLRAALASRHRRFLSQTRTTLRPQSTNMTSPVIPDACAPHRKTAAMATSSRLMPRGMHDRAPA